MKEYFLSMKTLFTKERLSSSIFWIGMGTIIVDILVLTGIDIKTITTWNILFNDILLVISNPYIIGSLLIKIIAFLNNPSNKTSW